jgi:predicted dehydrogenase
MTEPKTLGWAILGTGGVARKFVLDMAAHTSGSKAMTCASRNPENARRFAAGLPVAQAAESYEAAVTDAAVGAVYIATPPALHETHALMAINAGKAVLIEKPFALDHAAARRISEAAQTKGVFCMEAMWTRFQPLIGEILTRLPDLGELRGFDGQFCAANAPSPDSSLFAPEGGGSLLHRGIYPLYLSRLFLGEIAQMQTLSRLSETGADEETLLSLRHENGALSQIRSSLRTNGPEGGVVYGTKGTLYIKGPLYRPTGAFIRPTHASTAGTGIRDARKMEAFKESALGWRISSGLSSVKGRLKQQTLPSVMRGNGYHYQVVAVEQALTQGKTECAEMPLSDSLRLMELMDQARAEARTRA